MNIDSDKGNDEMSIDDSFNDPDFKLNKGESEYESEDESENEYMRKEIVTKTPQKKKKEVHNSSPVLQQVQQVQQAISVHSTPKHQAPPAPKTPCEMFDKFLSVAQAILSTPEAQTTFDDRFTPENSPARLKQTISGVAPLQPIPQQQEQTMSMENPQQQEALGKCHFLPLESILLV